MKKRVLALLLVASPLKVNAERLDLALGTARRPAPGAALPGAAKVTTMAPSTEVPAARRQISAQTVRNVFAARVEQRSLAPAAGGEHDSDLPPSMFVLDKPEVRKKSRRISIGPAGFMAGGKGLKLKIPF